MEKRCSATAIGGTTCVVKPWKAELLTGQLFEPLAGESPSKGAFCGDSSSCAEAWTGEAREVTKRCFVTSSTAAVPASLSGTALIETCCIDSELPTTHSELCGDSGNWKPRPKILP